MKQKLYSNAKWLASIFYICLAVVTVLALILRFSFQDMAVTPETYVETVRDEYFNYTINRNIYFKSPTAKGNILLENKSSYSMSVKIVDPEDPDADPPVVYTGYIHAGESRETVLLGQELENGTYEFIAIISAYDMEDPASSRLLAADEQPMTIYVGQASQKAAENSRTP